MYNHNFVVANEYYINKNYPKAIELYDKAIDENDNIGASLYNKGVCFVKLKQHEDALNPLFKSIQHKPIRSDAYFNIGYCYAVLKQFEKAYRYFSIANSLNPNDKETLRAIYLLTGEYKVCPISNKVWNGMANILRNVDRNL